MTTVVHMFPGQGSHQTGMGEGLFGRYPHLTRQADAVLGYSIEDLCLNADRERLSDTRYTQVAMYAVGALSYVDRVRDTGVVPDVLLGHSLGELVALFAAGAFDFVTGVELVARRAELMAGVGPGAMAAVIGIDADDLRRRLDGLDGGDAVTAANFNAPRQTVVAGSEEAIERVVAAMRAQDVSVMPLKVSGAFHSPHMALAAEEFGRYLRQYRFAGLKIPVIANVTARPYDEDPAVLLERQLTEPVRWADSVHHLLAEHADAAFEEIGPGRVLTGLLAQVREGVLAGA